MIPRTAGSKEKSVVVYNTFGPLSTVRLVYPVNFGLEALALQGELYEVDQMCCRINSYTLQSAVQNFVHVWPMR